MQSSANSLQGDWTQLGRSLMYTKKYRAKHRALWDSRVDGGWVWRLAIEYDLLVPSLQEMGYPLLGRSSYPVVVEFEEETTMGELIEGLREV